jgi:hypothetical protein
VADQDDVRRIALALPEVVEGEDGFGFSVRGKSIAWSWKERVHPKQARVPRDDVLAVRTPDQQDKAALIAGDPDVFFTEPHYNGFPAVLVRLPLVSLTVLEELLVDAWRVQAPKRLVAQTIVQPPSESDTGGR